MNVVFGPKKKPVYDVEQADIDQALLGLANPTVHTAHPKADKVIRQLWAEVQMRRAAE